MRPRKGTKTVSVPSISTESTIYKDETPEGDENMSKPFSKPFLICIYKDETPEGDEKNHGYNNLAISYHL